MTARLATGVALATVVALLAGACGGPPQQQRLPDLDFSDRPAIRLAVANIEIVNAWTMPFVAPHIEHEVPVAPAAAVEPGGLGPNSVPIKSRVRFRYAARDGRGGQAGVWAR